MFGKNPRDDSLIRRHPERHRAGRTWSLLARDVGMNREGLCKALSENGNPSFATVVRITRALGMQLRITV